MARAIASAALSTAAPASITMVLPGLPGYPLPDVTQDPGLSFWDGALDWRQPPPFPHYS